ncbi:efflux RND transporter periplasmic adaptor subunit [Microbispora sp. H10670]|uniref:efflux RND transporter periplasmic adaptor subunit n=1 Tax=Microbispora sp. H10670 TaxID=2729108 RepID=UPI0015FEB8E6|nr:efflux RND transporter periplasmic adaptor subunit [Microbispora sp. H10670]
MRSSAPYRVGGLALAGIVIASVAVISATGGDPSDAGRMSLASVRRGTVTAYVSAAGNTVDTGVRDLAFGAEGVVEKVYVKVGEKVRRGRVLARIDDTIAREDYEAAKAALAAARETLDDVRNGTATSSGGAGAGTAAAGSAHGTGTGSGAGAGAAGSNTGAPSGRSGPGTTGAGATGAGTTGAGAGSAGRGGSGGGQATCPTPSAHPSAHPTAQPSPRPTARPSARPSSGTRARAVSSWDVDRVPAAATALLAAYAPTGGTSTVLAISQDTEIYAGDGTTGTASSMLVSYQGGGSEPKPDPKPEPKPTSSPSRHPHPHPTRTHRPNPGHDGRTGPDPEVSISIPPTAPPEQSPGQQGKPSAAASPSPGRPSGTCAPGQGGQGQNRQGQEGRGTQGRTGLGGGQSGGRGGQAGQAGQDGRGGQAGQGGARLTEAQAEAQVSQATTELAEAKEALAGVRIKAPADGTVLSIAGTTGSRYTSGAFVTLGDLDNLQVQALFTESDIRFLKTGQPAVVTLPTQPGREFSGTVAHIDPTATTSDRLVRYGVRIDLDSRPARLLLGQSATVRVTTDEAADALYVPSQAVRVQSDGTAVVMVADGGAQVRRTVGVGVRGDTYVEVVTGLSEGDQVVLPATTTAFPDEGFPAPAEPPATGTP